MTGREPIRAVARREANGWWSIVADLGDREVASQARTRDDGEPMIREAIALALDIAPSDVHVEVEHQRGCVEEPADE